MIEAYAPTEQAALDDMYYAERKFPCRYCGADHQGVMCPRIKSIEFSETNPALWRRIKFFAPLSRKS